MDSMAPKIRHDGQTVFDREMEKMMAVARKLRDDTGAAFSDCVDAIDYAGYAGENYSLAVDYLRARRLAVSIPNMSFEERLKYFEEIEGRRNKTGPTPEINVPTARHDGPRPDWKRVGGRLLSTSDRHHWKNFGY